MMHGSGFSSILAPKTQSKGPTLPRMNDTKYKLHYDSLELSSAVEPSEALEICKIVFVWGTLHERPPFCFAS